MSRVVDVVLWTVAAVVLAATVTVSLLPLPDAIADVDLSDKLAHAGVYAALTTSWLFAVAWRPGRPGPGRSLGLWIVAGAIALGVLLEVMQVLVTRSPDLWDAVADVVGAGLGFTIWSVVRRRLGSERLRQDDVRHGGVTRPPAQT